MRAQAVTSSPMPRVIIANAVARCFVAPYPKMIAKISPPIPPAHRPGHGQRRGAHPNPPPPPATRRVPRCKPPEPEEHRVAERQEARLPHLHVVAESEDRHHAHLAQHRHHEARVARAAPVVEEPRQHERHGQGEEPRPMTLCQAGDAGRFDRSCAGVREDLAHVSRVPMSPRGLKSRMTISITNGRSAPIRGSGMVRNSESGVASVTLIPKAASASAGEYSSTTANVCT